MTIEIEQVTDFEAIEDAIEQWVAAGSDLPQLTDDGGYDLPKVRWQGFENIRKRPYAVVSIVSDLSPGRACTSQSSITENSVKKRQTTYTTAFNWNIQVAFYQDSYDSDGVAKRTTARQYAKNLMDRYQLPSIASILRDANIGFMPLSRAIQGVVMPDTDDDKYIHQAIIEFNLNGINEIKSKDSDFFDTVNTTINYYPEVEIDMRTEDFLFMVTESGDQMITEDATY